MKTPDNPAATRTRVSSLEEVLSYESDDLIHNFQEDWDLSYEDAKDLFMETRKRLWLNAVLVQERKDGVETVDSLFLTSGE